MFKLILYLEAPKKDGIVRMPFPNCCRCSLLSFKFLYTFRSFKQRAKGKNWILENFSSKANAI